MPLPQIRLWWQYDVRYFKILCFLHLWNVNNSRTTILFYVYYDRYTISQNSEKCAHTTAKVDSHPFKPESVSRHKILKSSTPSYILFSYFLVHVKAMTYPGEGPVGCKHTYPPPPYRNSYSLLYWYYIPTNIPTFFK